MKKEDDWDAIQAEAKAEDAKEAANIDKMKDFHNSPEYREMKEKAAPVAK